MTFYFTCDHCGEEHEGAGLVPENKDGVEGPWVIAWCNKVGGTAEVELFKARDDSPDGTAMAFFMMHGFSPWETQVGGSTFGKTFPSADILICSSKQKLLESGESVYVRPLNDDTHLVVELQVFNRESVYIGSKAIECTSWRAAIIAASLAEETIVETAKAIDEIAEMTPEQQAASAALLKMEAPTTIH